MISGLRSFLRCERGSAMPIVALGMFALIGATGTAVDMGRVQIVQSRMQNALDSAGLAAGASISTTNVTTEASKYFYVNFPANYLGTQITSFSATATVDNNLINLDVTGQVKTTFMKLLGITTVNVSAHSQITRANKGMELVLVMDNTGSMSSSGKLSAMKSAATDLINNLFGSNSTVPNLWVGLVPFTMTVNIGTSHASWTETNSFDWGPSPSAWMGCVDAREASGRDVTDDPPSVAKFPQYYWPDDSNNNWITTTTKNGKTTTTYSSPLNTSLGPNKNCVAAVTPMTASKSTILNGISSMTALGNTHIGIGAVWGWRMLSPRWQGLWGGEMNTNSLPLAYNTPLMSKVMVLLTDGDNTMDNSNHTAYWYLSNGKLGTTNSTTAVNSLNTRLATVCTSAKANNIIIYTIGLSIPSSDTTAINLLRNCATKPEYYFNSPTASDLQAVFRSIADSLANLRVSK